MNISETMQSLYANYGELEGITIECQNELIAIGINNNAASAEIFLQGAQISRYQQAGQDPILWLSDECDFTKGTSLRGGIPVCWPWFADIRKNPQAVQTQFTERMLNDLEMHGFVRVRDWEISKIETPSQDLTIVELHYQIHAEQERQWPFATALVYRVEIGAELKASLSVQNQDSMPFTFSQALHTYFSISHIDDASISSFDQGKYIDTLDDWNTHTQQGDIVFAEEVDRIYHSAPNPTELSDKNRKITISSEGSNSTVVWNPWIAKAKRLSHFGDDAYKEMLCIENANIMDDIVSLEPQEKHTLSIVIK